jgi:hypothetical protein
MIDAADAQFPGDHLGDEMRALIARTLAEAAALPAPINTCRAHPDALPGERTIYGRQGCVGCLQDPGNLDPADKGIDGVDVDSGETRCPRCAGMVSVVLNAAGVLVAYDQSGAPHSHRRISFGQAARDARRDWSLEAGHD